MGLNLTRLQRNFDVTDPDESSIYATLSSPDPLHVALYAAIYIENQLDAFIAEHSKSPNAVKRLQLDYSGKLDLAIVLGLASRLRPPIAAIGTIRNQFAHRLAMKLTDANADSVYHAFSAEDKQRVQSVYERVRSTAKGRPKKLAAVPPLDRLALFALTLRGALIVARSEGGNTDLLVEAGGSAED